MWTVLSTEVVYGGIEEDIVRVGHAHMESERVSSLVHGLGILPTAEIRLASLTSS